MTGTYVNTLPDNGRIIQNIIQGCDLVMSHITHLYHLSALDFINTSGYPSMGPWLPSYTASDMLVATGADTNTTANTLVLHYVQALAIRRKCHTAGALFSGRQPIQNAMVPGGVTTLFSSTMPGAVTIADSGGPFNATTTQAKFKSLMNEVRAFINTKYIPDVLTVAGAYGKFWTEGIGCQQLLAYGDYPVTAAGKMAIKRGAVEGLTKRTFNQANIREFVNSSYYTYDVLDAGTGKHPYSGVTVPNMGSGGYSWIKSPRLIGSGAASTVFEVGPLARMVMTYLCPTTQVTASENGLASADTLGTVLGLGPLASYTVTQLVNAAVNKAHHSAWVGATLLNTPLTAELGHLYSALGRHAARALEAKYIADLMAGGSDGIAPWVDQLAANGKCYTYSKIPKVVCKGYGLTEAPRGALGHWIQIEGKKVAKYQCVVPSTWNFSPLADGNPGPVEQALNNSHVGTTPTDMIVNILRLVHPFDCCIACAVHVLNPEGKETLKFAIGPDGKPSNVEIKG
jgi:hydrogenase large subunit